MADMDEGQAEAQGQQPKEAVNYRQGGDICHVCVYGRFAQGETGTCTQVAGPINGHDVCDLFARAGRAREEQAEGEAQAQPEASEQGAAGVADRLARRGMISDKAMAGLRDGGAY